MKKIFYKIFLTLLLITYIPLIILYSFHGFYMKKYVENQKISELKEITYFFNNKSLNELTEKKIEELEKKKNIKLDVVDIKLEKEKSEIFKYLNEKLWKINLNNMTVNSVEIRFQKSTNLLNKIYIIKKVSDNKYIIISSLMVIPEVIYRIILSSYFYITPFLVVFLLILTYFISKKMSDPIENLEEVSTKALTINLSKTSILKDKDELAILENNIISMAINLKKKNNELKNLNQKLKLELEKNRKFMKFEKEFINSISHELKTPIAIINGYIEILQEKIVVEKDEIEKIYSVMYKEGIYLDKMIKDLNSYHAYQHEFFTIKKEKINLRELFEKILEKYLLDIKEKKIKLKLDIDEDIINTDIKKIEVVINNLLTNAITYVNEKEIINIYFKNKEFIIENSSDFIPKEKIENLFKPFYKLDFARKRKYGGTGLGLSIVKNILDVLQFDYNIDFDNDRNFFIFRIKFN